MQGWTAKPVVYTEDDYEGHRLLFQIGEKRARCATRILDRFSVGRCPRYTIPRVQRSATRCTQKRSCAGWNKSWWNLYSTRCDDGPPGAKRRCDADVRLNARPGLAICKRRLLARIRGDLRAGTTLPDRYHSVTCTRRRRRRSRAGLPLNGRSSSMRLGTTNSSPRERCLRQSIRCSVGLRIGTASACE